jgi:hypothetical protein
MVRVRTAFRLGFRAASRNGELAFAKALLDLAGTLLSLLPSLLFVALALRLTGLGDPLATLLRLGQASRAAWLPLTGAALAGGALSWALTLAFLGGALPLLTADAELGARPPAGSFLRLATSAFPRLAAAGAVTTGLLLLVNTVLLVAVLAAPLVLGPHPGPAAVASVALVLAFSFVGGLLLDLLARLTLVRAAIFGEGATKAFARAAGLLGDRLGALLGLWLLCVFVEVVVATSLATLGSGLDTRALTSLADAILTLAPRAALAIVGAVLFAWVELGRLGALAILAADAEGLITIEEPVEVAPPRDHYSHQQRRVTVSDLSPRNNPPLPPRERPQSEPVVEALPVPEEEQVIEALPVPEAGCDSEGGRKGEGAGNGSGSGPPS